MAQSGSTRQNRRLRVWVPVVVFTIAAVVFLIAGDLLPVFMVAAIGLAVSLNTTGLVERSGAAKWLVYGSIAVAVVLGVIYFYTNAIS
jgi:hypothetical protein